jgi:hypothetical protein
VTARALSYDHLLRLSDDIGVVEHATGREPLTSSGYCLDDVARALVVIARDEAAPSEVVDLGEICLDFVVSALTPDGRAHNRRPHGSRLWSDEPSCGDWWGRAIWALGTVVRAGTDPTGRALRAFDYAARARSPHLRSMAYAGVGAAEVLERYPGYSVARTLLEDGADLVAGASEPGHSWPWPEPRLRYANGVLPEVVVAAGSAARDRELLSRGLALLAWLVAVETAPAGHLSVTPASGWAAGEPRPGFDQQPVEVAALAEACARALRVTGDRRWSHALARAGDWFEGRNDHGVPMADENCGGGFDGLTVTGVNRNEGAESTLALLSVRQLVRHTAGSVGWLDDE